MNNDTFDRFYNEFKDWSKEDILKRTYNIILDDADKTRQIEQLENIRKEAIEELSYMSTDAYVEDYDIREKHYNLLMSILNKGNDKE